MPENYCLNVGKTIWVQFPDNTSFNRSSLGTPTGHPTPVSNLLNERYDDEKYNVFLKATLRASNDRNKYKIELNIDTDTIEGFIGNQTIVEYFQSPSPMVSNDIPAFTRGTNLQSSLYNTQLEVQKNSDFICLDYIPRNDMLYFGAKVLVFFDKFIYQDGGSEIAKENVKYLGVVIGFVTEEIVKVMLSINSYESDIRRTPKVGRRHYSSNPIIETPLSKVTLFKKAEQCI
jgi:hypothetical protein